MATSITIQQYVEGVVSDEIVAGISMIEDPIDMLNTQNIKHVDSETVNRWMYSDANVVSQSDNKGDVSGNTHLANLRDRTYNNDTFTFPASKKIAYEIPSSMCNKFGVTAQTLGNSADFFEKDIARTNDFAAMLQEMVINPGMQKMKIESRKEVTDLFKNAGTVSAPNYQKPLGLPMVGTTSDRASYWTYDNKLTSVLSDSSMRSIVNLFANGQKNVLNQEFGMSAPMMILHSTDIALAGEVFLPETVVNANYRNSAGYIQELAQITKKLLGVYGDTDHADDFVVLGKNHKIYRLAFVSPTGKQTNGYWARVYPNLARGSLIVEIEKRSIMVIDGPEDFVKSIVPTE